MTRTEPTDQVLVDITISAPIDQVWQALRDPEAIANWFGWAHDGLAEEIDYIFVTHAFADEATHSIRFAEWEQMSHRLALSPLPGPVERTRLRLVISGAADLDWEGVYEEVREGWVCFFEQLRFAMARHAGQRRHSLYLSADARTDALPLLERLGLQPLAARQPGQAYRLSSALGDISGQVWHRTRFQIGIRVGSWGDALLVLTEKGHADGPAQPASSLILSAYGVSDEDFAALQQRCRRGWQGKV